MRFFNTAGPVRPDDHTLLSVLRQLRAGYQRRPGAFPQSVVLCGVRDIRDFRD